MPEVSPQARGIVTLHAWHDVPLGARIEDHFAAVIEIPKGSKVKYELARSELREQHLEDASARLHRLEEEDGEAGDGEKHESYDGDVAALVHAPISSCSTLGGLYRQSSHAHWPLP